jgi:putative acetyltransferase
MASLQELYSLAFPKEDLWPLVEALQQENRAVYSLGYEHKNSIIAHMILSKCSTVKKNTSLTLLGPLCVLPSYQRKGIGSTLIEYGLDFSEKNIFAKTLVLGDPDYYSRFGFEPEAVIAPPYPLAETLKTAWQSLALTDKQGEEPDILTVPLPWQNPIYWQA